MTVTKVGLRVQASSGELKRRCIERLQMDVVKQDKTFFSFPMHVIESTGLSEAVIEGDPHAELPGSRAVFVPLETPIEIAERQCTYAMLNFDGLNVDQMFHERGPAARWLKIIGYLYGTSHASVR